MTEITLKYNPFEARASYEYKGKNKTFPKCMGTGENSRLQDWLYDFFPNLWDIHNWGDGSECTVSFWGTPGDFEDVEHAANVFQKDHPGLQIKVNHLNPQSKSLGTRLGDLRKAFERMQNESPYEELKNPALKHSFEQALSSEFEISVIATMSSGKSTLINAILGQEILPARNEATTAKIAQIRDVDNAKGFTVRGFKKDNTDNYIPATDETAATLEELEKLNSSDDIAKIEITGNIPGINSREMRLLLSDTPGPNNSRSIDHAKHIDELIKADYKPMIMYILNATQPETIDDKNLLEKISKAMEGSGKQGADRFLFVLNKADVLDPDKKEFVEQKVADFKVYLEKNNITGARIFPASAELAKLIHKSQAGRELTQKEKLFLGNKELFIKQKEMHLSDYVSLSPSCRKRQEEILQDAEAANDENAQALVYSGISAIELAMDEYLEKYALTAKVSKAVGVFINIIKRLDLKNKTELELVHNEDNRKKVESELKTIRSQIENGAEAKKLKGQFDENIVSITKKLDTDFKKHETTINKLSANESENYTSDDISPAKAKKIVDTTKKNMQLQYAILSFDLSALFEKELKSQAQNYLDQYRHYISGLIETKDYTMSAALNLINVAIPDNADELLDKFSGTITETTTKKIRHSAGNPDKAWWKFWTWFDDEYHVWYEDEEVKTQKNVIKMKALFESSIEPQFQQFFQMIETARSVATENALGLKNFFASEIDRLDATLKQTILKEEESIKSQEAIEQKIKENKEKAAWLSGFITEVEAILEV
jgi:predicted GTPase